MGATGTSVAAELVGLVQAVLKLLDKVAAVGERFAADGVGPAVGFAFESLAVVAGEFRIE